MTTKSTFSLFAAVLIALTGCDILNPVDSIRHPETNVVLTGFLTPGAPVEVTLRSSIPFTEYYPFRSLDRYAIDGAIAVITVDGVAHTLIQDPARPGVYTAPGLTTQSGSTYGVSVTFPDGHQFDGWHLTSSTTVPGPVQMNATLSAEQLARGARLDSLVFPRGLANPGEFQAAESLTPISISWDPADGAAGYLVGVIAEDTLGTGILRKRAYEDWLDGEFNNPQLRQNLQKSGFFTLPDSMNADIFWLLFGYKGEQSVSVFACDTGYFDYFFTLMNGAGQSGADADRGPKLNVKGGLGVFGSYAADTVKVRVYPEWLPSAHMN